MRMAHQINFSIFWYYYNDKIPRTIVLFTHFTKEFVMLLKFQALQMIGDIDMFAPMIKLADMISQWMNQVYTLSFEYISQNVTGPDWIGNAVFFFAFHSNVLYLLYIDESIRLSRDNNYFDIIILI